MEAQLQHIIKVQTEQNQLLKNQLRWLKVGLLTLLVTVAVSACCLGYLIRERGKSIVVTTDPIIEHPISLANEDATQFQIPAKSLAENEATQSQFSNRIAVPPMSRTVPIQLDFSNVFSEAKNRPRHGCDGMCL